MNKCRARRATSAITRSWRVPFAPRPEFRAVIARLGMDPWSIRAIAFRNPCRGKKAASTMSNRCHVTVASNFWLVSQECHGSGRLAQLW
jgi:hypothetical protein